ncbi:sigma-70 family RNA polymerase sigma factor [Janthinobacterium sp. TB1-E2]|uniref:Sigma-70 family RNA polymerase sigma factor n=1 Tax=Janthinobacterium aestuarii TaxID=2985511 RepID=A0ABZ2GFS5_9BURK
MSDGNENFSLEINCVNTASAFHALYIRYRIRIRNLVSQSIPREEDIDDMVQLIFFNVFLWFKRGCGCSMFYPKLYSMAMRCIRSDYRGDGEIKSSSLDLIDDTDYSIGALKMVHEDSPEEICSAMETGMEIIRLIANLPAPLKKALLLREDEGMRYDEIAIRMGCPMGTVRSRIHRVRAEIRKILEKDQ